MTQYANPPEPGPEMPAMAPANPPKVKQWRSIAKALSWRTIGSLDTLLLSYLMITYIGPYFGLEASSGEAIEAASYIAITEVITKIIFYYFHERFWAWVQWGTSVVDGRRRESLRRTSTKTASFRTIATLDTILLAWFFTGSVQTALSIGGLEVFTKLALYFMHERIWARLPFGIVH
ncbi:DUF2061 domain-containing protein [Qipengyuania marisflavi]|uniref:DUF2061 domain-containing protein n=1 Tax=Qipengyuania marisflavi TaxID=2486356 RepID=A0A5S3NY68_9SPHN|nr:DUF2061 domain-containing protein [Qipengyuania marisflavi]TMM45332.1 DUF2061 domain-containing protein [Qipengyuania marisflavi]